MRAGLWGHCEPKLHCSCKAEILPNSQMRQPRLPRRGNCRVTAFGVPPASQQQDRVQTQQASLQNPGPFHRVLPACVRIYMCTCVCTRLPMLMASAWS